MRAVSGILNPCRMGNFVVTKDKKDDESTHNRDGTNQSKEGVGEEGPGETPVAGWPRLIGKGVYRL